MKMLVATICLCFAAVYVLSAQDSIAWRALPNENTWAWLARNHLRDLPGEGNVEVEPDKPLATAYPFSEPIPTDEGYNSDKETLIFNHTVLPNGSLEVRVFKRGVFTGYSEIHLVKPPQRHETTSTAYFLATKVREYND